jgi:hypothetical protein
MVAHAIQCVSETYPTHHAPLSTQFKLVSTLNLSPSYGAPNTVSAKTADLDTLQSYNLKRWEYGDIMRETVA